MAQNADILSVEAVAELDAIVAALLQTCLVTEALHIVQKDDAYSLAKKGKRVTNGVCRHREIGDGRRDENRGRRKKGEGSRGKEGGEKKQDKKLKECMRNGKDPETL